MTDVDEAAKWMHDIYAQSLLSHNAKVALKAADPAKFARIEQRIET